MQGFRVPNASTSCMVEKSEAATLECQCLGEPAAENTALSTSVASVEICFQGRAHNKIKTFNK